MESSRIKCGKKRNRRRRTRRGRGRGKVEVMSYKRQKLASDPSDYRDYSNSVNESNTSTETVTTDTSTMENSSFWSNYEAAEEWQKKHSVTWWRTRCFALEYENHVLKNTIRNLVQNQSKQADCRNHEVYKTNNVVDDDFSHNDNCQDEENLEFHLNEDMMAFIEQSMRHKIELKKKREQEAEDAIAEEQDNADLKLSIEGGFSRAQERIRDAKLLYGDTCSSTILAMETALQATIDRHKDKSKPQYWPNIPLKL